MPGSTVLKRVLYFAPRPAIWQDFRGSLAELTDCAVEDSSDGTVVACSRTAFHFIVCHDIPAFPAYYEDYPYAGSAPAAAGGRNLRARTVPLEEADLAARVRASLEYQLLKDEPEPGVPAGKTSITQSVTTILADGVAAILSQSADPLTDRKVTLEVKATIVK